MIQFSVSVLAVTHFSHGKTINIALFPTIIDYTMHAKVSVAFHCMPMFSVDRIWRRPTLSLSKSLAYICVEQMEISRTTYKLCMFWCSATQHGSMLLAQSCRGVEKATWLFKMKRSVLILQPIIIQSSTWSSESDLMRNKCWSVDLLRVRSSNCLWSQIMRIHTIPMCQRATEKRGKANEKLEVINLNISHHTLNIV